MTKYSRAKRTEKREIGALNLILNEQPLITELTRGDDDFPLIDGYVHLLGDQEEVDGNMLKVQVKPLKLQKNGLPTATCSVDLLSYAQSSSLPVILIGVDPDRELAHWIYLSPESTAPLYHKQIAKQKKSATVHLNKNDAIKKGAGTYIQQWSRICSHHRNTSNDRLSKGYKQRITDDFPISEDALLERLKTLRDIVYYRTNKGEYPFIEVAFKIFDVVNKSSVQVKIIYLSLLEQLIYDSTSEVLGILAKLLRDDDKEVKQKVTELLIKISKYDYNILNAIGYGPYRATITFLNNQDISSDLSIEMLGNLLNPDYEGTSYSDIHTVTFHMGPLNATPFLRKMRRDAIEILLQRYEKADTIRERIKILTTMSYATHKTNAPLVEDQDFLKRSIDMVNSDTIYIVEAYKKASYSGSAMIDQFPVLCYIEEQLSLLNRREPKPKGAHDLLQEIRTNQNGYKLYRTLAGDETHLRMDAEWRDAQRIKEQDLEEILNSITEDNAHDWYDRMNIIADFRDQIDDHNFESLRQILERIAEEKPSVSKIFFERAIENKTGLYFFLSHIFLGIRKSLPAQWDEFVEEIASQKITYQVNEILASLVMNRFDESKDCIRDQDIDVVLEIAERSKRFSFLQDAESNPILDYRVFQALERCSAKNEKARKALTKRLKGHPELKETFSHELDFALHRGWIKLETWDRDDLEILTEMLITMKRLNHNDAQILHDLGRHDFELMMSVFEKRIKNRLTYHAIPNHFETSFSTFIRENPKSRAIFRRWLMEMDPEKEKHVGQGIGELLKHLGVGAFRDVLSELIATHDKDNILRVLSTLPISDSPDFDLCFEIVIATDDDDILKFVSFRMRQFGGCSGAVDENIFGRELQKIQNQVKEIVSESTNQKIIKFCKKLLVDLREDILRSEQGHQRNMRKMDAQKAELSLSGLG